MKNNNQPDSCRVGSNGSHGGTGPVKIIHPSVDERSGKNSSTKRKVIKRKRHSGRVPLEDRLRGISRETPEVKHLSNLLLLQLLRVDRALDLEEAEDALDAAGDRQMEMARKLLSDLVRLKFDLGMLKKSQDEQEMLNPYEQAARWGRPTLGELLENIEGSERKTVIEILEKTLLGMPGTDGSGVSPVVGSPESGTGRRQI